MGESVYSDHHSRRSSEDAESSGSHEDFDYYSSKASSRYGDDDYDSPRRRRRRRRRHRSSSRDLIPYDHSQPHHSKGKDFAATLLGAVVGGRIGSKVSDGGFWCTAAGVFMGAWAGHDLEKMWEFHQHQEKFGKSSSRRHRY